MLQKNKQDKSVFLIAFCLNFSASWAKTSVSFSSSKAVAFCLRLFSYSFCLTNNYWINESHLLFPRNLSSHPKISTNYINVYTVYISYNWMLNILGSSGFDYICILKFHPLKRIDKDTCFGLFTCRLWVTPPDPYHTFSSR